MLFHNGKENCLTTFAAATTTTTTTKSNEQKLTAGQMKLNEKYQRSILDR